MPKKRYPNKVYSGQRILWIKLFLSIIRAAFLGERFVYKGKIFDLEPTLVKPSDFYRRIDHPSTQYEALLNSLDLRFKNLAKSEIYRVKGGWIAHGLKGSYGMKIRRIKVGKETFLLPVLYDKPSIGIDTSSIRPNITVIAVCFIPDYEAAYTYLERHLKLPKTHNHHKEYKWSKLNRNFRSRVLERFELLLSICCNGILVIQTDALIYPIIKLENIFKNLIEGCFSGYERHPTQKHLRPALKRKFFEMANGTPIHCDADFRPLTPDKVVRLFVQTLAKRNGRYLKYTPLFANLRSHESKPIQIADIIVGAIRTKIQEEQDLKLLKPLFFDKRKLKSCPGRFAKAYYWIASEQ